MKILTIQYHPTTGWSSMLPSHLDSDQTLVLVFGAPAFAKHPHAIQTLTESFPRSHCVGCSTSGEIYGTAMEDDSLSVAIVKFDHSRVATAVAPVQSAADSRSAGLQLGKSLLHPGLRAVFVLSDGTQVNGSELVGGLNEALPKEVVVTGGLAGDGPRFDRTWVLHHGKLSSGFVAAVGLYGDRLQLGVGSQGGWDIFGPEREVTRSQGNVLYELGGKPALQLYKVYLGELAAGLPASALLFPLSLRSGPGDDKRIVRTILKVDENAQSLIFAGDVPQGYRAQLMRANVDRLVQGASDAASSAISERSPESPCLCIAISCVGRRLVLGERTDEELEAIGEVLPHGSRMVGFYSYGELSPVSGGRCDLHNQTMTLTTLWEE